MKFPSFSQWKQIFKVLKKREKITLLVFFAIALSSFAFLSISLYISNTSIVPSFGGSYTEGVVGQPRFINPIYGETNDTDRALIQLVFSGLMNYDKDGKITEDLALNYKISEDGKIYDFKIKDNVVWHDLKPLTAEDVVFTINTIRNSDYKSPLRANFIDVGVEKTSEKSVRFTLKSPYNSFIENLTVKIIPKHIWGNISPENFALSPYNLKPVGSGPFEFSDIKSNGAGLVKTIKLRSNRRYYNEPAYISSLSFHFFKNKEDILKSANARQIDGFSLAPFEGNESLVLRSIRDGWSKNEKFSSYHFLAPRYFAVFFNSATTSQKTNIFSDKNVRKALAYTIDKDELAKKLSEETKNIISKTDSPIIPDFFGYEGPSNIYEFNIDEAKKLLDQAGFVDNGSAPLTTGGAGQREKPINKKPAFQFTGYLKIGSKGLEVSELQLCLSHLSDNLKNLLQNEKSGAYTDKTGKAVTEFQKQYLPHENQTGETGNATRKKLNELCIAPSKNSIPLKFTITTVAEPQLIKVADMLKNYWQSAGASVDVSAISIGELKQAIKNRKYEVLLYGEALGSLPDLYPFWHSSQKIDPGLNLSSYENKRADQLIKDARETLDLSIKQKKYEELQDLIISDAPAIFLYNPSYVYWASQKVKGIDAEKIIDPAKRFSNITNWHIKTKREWK